MADYYKSLGSKLEEGNPCLGRYPYYQGQIL